MALSIFPTEVWEHILDFMGKPTDIIAVLDAFPELRAEGVQHHKKPKWLFSSVFPHLSEWQSMREVMACKQVCKSWRDGVDEFVSKLHLPYNGQATSPFPNLNPFKEHFGRRLISGLAGFDNADSLEQFAKLFPATNPINPFPGKRAKFYGLSTGDGESRERTSERFWRATLDLLRVYGHHLEHLMLRISMERGWDHVPHFIGSFLQFVPNLKTLRFDFSSMRIGDSTREDEQLCAALDNLSFRLPNLCSLSVSGLQRLTDKLVSHFCSGLDKLVISVPCWMRYNYGDRLTHLTDLTLKVGDVAELGIILNSLQNPAALLKLSIQSCLFDEEELAGIADGAVLSALGRFSRLEYVRLLNDNRCFHEEPICNMEEGIFNGNYSPPTLLTSVKTLQICQSRLCMHLKLFACFPNVTKLSICHPFDVKRSYYRQNKSLWEELLPRLQLLVLNGWLKEHSNEGRISIRLFRSHYEYYKLTPFSEEASSDSDYGDSDSGQDCAELGIAELFNRVL